MTISELADINPFIFIGNEPEEHMSAIVGMSNNHRHLIYSYTKLLVSFMNKGMTRKDAEEWIGYNVYRTLDYYHEDECYPIILEEFPDGVEKD